MYSKPVDSTAVRTTAESRVVLIKEICSLSLHRSAWKLSQLTYKENKTTVLYRQDYCTRETEQKERTHTICHTKADYGVGVYNCYGMKVLAGQLFLEPYSSMISIRQYYGEGVGRGRVLHICSVWSLQKKTLCCPSHWCSPQQADRTILNAKTLSTVITNHWMDVFCTKDFAAGCCRGQSGSLRALCCL